MKYSFHIIAVLVVMWFAETVQAQRSGRGTYKPRSVEVEPGTHMNALKTRSKRSIWEVLRNRNGSNRVTNMDMKASESLVKEFKERFGFENMEPHVSATLTNTLAINREARVFMDKLKTQSILLSRRDKQMTHGEFILRKKLVEALALSGSNLTPFLKDSIYGFGIANTQVVAFRSRVLTEAMQKMQEATYETPSFSRVLNQVLARNGIGKSKRRQCM